MTCIVNKVDIDYLIKTDKIFAGIHKKYGSPPNWNRPQGFVSLSMIILEQQVSLESAKAHFIKLNNYLPEFTPHEIQKLSDEEMRNCQISRQKTVYLRALSKAIIHKQLDLETLPALSLPDVRQQLKAIKGIGDWTVDIYQMFCLQAKDLLPLGDIAVVASIQELTDAKTKEEMLDRAERWKPYRSLATFFLWHYYLKKRNKG